MLFELEKFKKRIAITDEEYGDISYQEVAAYADAIYENIKERCVVLSLCQNTPGSLVGYISFINHRIVPLLLNAGADKDFIEAAIIKYQPQFIWVPEELSQSLKKFRKVYSSLGYTLLKTDFKPYALYDELALLLSSSGSTGSPKYIRLSYKNLSANAASIACYLNIDENERPVTTLPMNYSYGLSIINSHLISGARILLTEKSMMEKEFWSFLKKHSATSFGGVPFTYQLLKKLKFHKMSLPSLKTMTQAGGRLPLKLNEEFSNLAKEKQIKFFVMYGQTEATARMSYLPYEMSLKKCGSVGVAIPGGRFYLKDTKGNIIDMPNTTGELFYEGDNVFLGYANTRQDLKEGDLNQGTLKTGDLAYFDEDGYLYIAGRISRFLKIFGNRLNLDETEEILRKKYTSLEIVCSGVDDKLYVFIVSDKEIEGLKDYLQNKTGINQSAFKVIYLSAIPKNASGKILYKDLEEYFKQ